MTGYDAASIGKRVASYRRAAGMTAEQLASAVGGGLTRSAVAKLENGHRVEVSTDLLVQLAWALKVPPLVLLFPLHDESAGIEVGDVSSTAEHMGYWILGLPIVGSEVGGASEIGNAIHAQYRQLVINSLGLVNDVRTQIIESGTLSKDEAEALNRSADQSAEGLRLSRSMLQILRQQLGVADG